jgi:hypothetical protein
MRLRPGAVVARPLNFTGRWRCETAVGILRASEGGQRFASVCVPLVAMDACSVSWELNAGRGTRTPATTLRAGL